MELKELTLGEIFQLHEAIQALLDLEPAPPAKVGIKIARLAKVLVDEFNLVNGQRNKLILKYGTDQGSGQWRVEEEQEQPFRDELNELFAQKTKVEFERVLILPESNIPTRILAALQDFLTVE